MKVLKNYRRRHGLSMQQAADSVGVSRVTWLRWEDGTRAIGVKRLYELSDRLNIPMSQLRPDIFKAARKMSVS